MFNQFSSEIVVHGESQADLDMEDHDQNRLIKPKRTFFLSTLRCLGAFAQIGLFTYLAYQKLEELNRSVPDFPSHLGRGPVSGTGPRIFGREIDEDWPLWLPVMHGIIWVYASILSVVSLLHPRLSNPYKLVTHLDIIYLATAGGGLFHFLQNNFGRPIGLWKLDDQISGLSAVVSGCMLCLTLATKPLVPPQPIKGPEKRSRGVISPETRSSLYARIAFTWLHPMVIKSFHGKLRESDVWATEKDLRIKTNFQNYLECRKQTVFVTMFHLFRFDLAQQYIWALAWTGLSMVPPFVVFKIIEFAQDISTYNRNEALFYAAMLLVSVVIRSAVLQRGLHMGQRVATKAMGMASGLIYEKMSLRKDMDPYGYDITVAVDLKHIGQGWRSVFYLMIYPTMFILSTIQLYGYIGHSAWFGALAVMAWYPISALASFLFSGRFDPAPPKMDQSNALVSDILTNLKALKYLGWEEILIKKAIKAREEERKMNSKISQPVMTLISVPLGADLVHAFTMVVLLSVYSLYFGQLLTPATLFTILILVDIQTNAINSLPSVIINLKEMLDSMVRINDFLGDDENERDTAVIRDREMARRANIPIIGFVNATFIWPEAKPPRHGNEVIFVQEPDDDDDGHSNNGGNQRSSKSTKRGARVNANWIVRTLSLFGYSLPTPPPPYVPPNARPQYGVGVGQNDQSVPAEKFVLKDVTLYFPPGQISLVTGTKKSGKSALLLALIGEMTRTSGKIYLPRKDYYHGKQGYGSDVAYVSQDPWLEIGGGGIVNGSSTGRSTIRDTILFGTVMDEQRYVDVLRACVLEGELRGLPNGDMTMIGDKNVIWSMSLKQRISLARAVYADVSHILMDDCLSFVDVKTRHFIWKNCLLGPITQNKTRILVTNQFHVKTYLNDADYVVGLDQGYILGHGTVREILSQGWIRQAPGSTSIPTTIVPGASVPANMGQLPPPQSLPEATASGAPLQDLKSSKSTNLPLNKMSNLGDYDDLDSTLRRETAAGFKVGWTTFGTYILSLGSVMFLFSAFIGLFLGQALLVMRIGWLGIWAENEARDGDTTLQHTLRNRFDRNAIVGVTSPIEPTTHCDYIMIFIALAGARALFVIGNAFFLRAGANAGADRVYAQLLRGVLAARLSIFEANTEKAATTFAVDAGGLFSKGTINGIKECFQRDLGGLDVKLAKEFWQFSADFLAVFMILLVLIWILPFVFIPMAVVLFLLCWVALLGLGLSKEMHRMAIRADRMNKDQFKHMFRGLATIRGYGLERRAIKAGIAQAECYLKTVYFGAIAERWVHWKVDLLGAFIPFSCAILILQSIEEVDPVLMGLSLYLSLQFSDKVLDCLLGYGRIRNRLQWALERTRRYIHELNKPDNKEAPRVVPNKRPPAGWPHSGAVEYINYSCKHSQPTSTVGTETGLGKTGIRMGAANKPVSKATGPSLEAGAPPQNQNQNQNRSQLSGGAPISRALAPSAPLGDSMNVRTNTGVSAANTVASGTSHLSSVSRNSVATNNTVVGNGHGQSSASETSIATLIPLPTPSSTFKTTTTVPAPEAPMDQLAALDQTDVQDQTIEAPLPPLPPTADGSSSVKTSNGRDISIMAETGFGPITCTIQPGEKIAVVGQSKSGKSTFVQSLFRIWDTAEEDRARAAHTVEQTHSAIANNTTASKGTKNKRTNSSATNSSSSSSKTPFGFFSKGNTKSFHDLDVDLGLIRVDGLDIAQLGLADLRSRFGYLSQRGTIFAGTVRFNLDPLSEHEDAELNDVLKACFLNERLKLDTELITPATASLSLSIFAGVNGDSTSQPSALRHSRVSRYKKRLFGRNRTRADKGKGKSKDYRSTASAPATISASTGRDLQDALDGQRQDLAEIEQRLFQSVPEELSQESGVHEDSDSDMDDELEDDSRVELDTNERQLLSLARILIQRPNVVILDNCSSKVTDLTAQRIDQIVVQELKHATILSVGHRLDQIVARHDRILVLEHGKIVEFDTPMALLNLPNGVFRNICNPSGPNFSSLVSIAKKQQIQQQQQQQQRQQ
ncbi:hypothetical protein BGZ50_000316 [Haplosporangium sp. Z 11]|nr:hypothetical protein BGZ50_000316 [Haplosporangium sp. Z 11]